MNEPWWQVGSEKGTRTPSCFTAYFSARLLADGNFRLQREIGCRRERRKRTRGRASAAWKGLQPAGEVEGGRGGAM